MQSCSNFSKNVYLRSFNRFVDRVEKKCDSWDEIDWDRADAKFNVFQEKYEWFSDDFTVHDHKLYNKLVIKYRALEASHFFRFRSDVQGGKKQEVLVGSLEGIIGSD